MRIESVILKNHSNVSIFGGNIINQGITDINFAGRDLFQTRDHS